MTPVQFQSEALAWIGVISLILIAAAGAIGKVIGAVQATQAEIRARQDRQSVRIDTALANTPAPGQSAVTVTAPAATTQNVETAEAPISPTNPGGSVTPATPESGAGASPVVFLAPPAPADASAPVSGAVGAISAQADGIDPNKTGGFTHDQLAPVAPPAQPALEPEYPAGEGA